MRRQNDFYPTPEWATQSLMRHVGVRGTVLEPCAGDGAIARVVDGVLEANHNGGFVYTSDIAPQMNCSFCGDATRRDFWEQASEMCDGIDWVVTNPPFSVAPQIVPLAYEHAAKGIAMLLRLSYLEPVENRGTWLNEHPPTILIVLPRISFTNDGKTDNVTCAWMVWWKGHEPTRIIVEENPRFVSQQKETLSFATA